jgi:hypothetical protein
VEAARQGELREKAVSHQDLAEETAGALLLVERGFELVRAQKPSLDQQLAKRSPVGVVIDFVERLGHLDPLPRLSARTG